jgi:hypothetical protein
VRPQFGQKKRQNCARSNSARRAVAGQLDFAQINRNIDPVEVVQEQGTAHVWSATFSRADLAFLNTSP